MADADGVCAASTPASALDVSESELVEHAVRAIPIAAKSANMRRFMTPQTSNGYKLQHTFRLRGEKVALPRPVQIKFRSIAASLFGLVKRSISPRH